MPQDRNIMIINKIRDILRKHELGILTLEELQENIEGESGAIEGPNTKILVEAISNFLNRLELLIYASLPGRKRKLEVDSAIGTLLESLSNYADLMEKCIRNKQVT